jgi:hypothetical protein
MNFDINSLLEVSLKKPDDFLKIKETLTRIGVASKKERILYQSCHILHKQGRYFIVHFKELFAIDGKEASITNNDLARRNTITGLLKEWGLVDTISIIDEDNLAPLKQFKILPFAEKEHWKLVAKYSIGNKGSYNR